MCLFPSAAQVTFLLEPSRSSETAICLSPSGRPMKGVSNMKRAFFIVILVLAGFAVGVVTMEALSRPARRAYREMLQRNFVQNQSRMAYDALKRDDDLGAAIHLWAVMEAGPDGSDLFKDLVSKGLDETVFVSFPLFNNFLKKGVRLIGKEEAVKAAPHGELAVVLDQIGYKKAAAEHFIIASQLLNMPEDRVRQMFQEAMKRRKDL